MCAMIWKLGTVLFALQLFPFWIGGIWWKVCLVFRGVHPNMHNYCLLFMHHHCLLLPIYNMIQSNTASQYVLRNTQIRKYVIRNTALQYMHYHCLLLPIYNMIQSNTVQFSEASISVAVGFDCCVALLLYHCRRRCGMGESTQPV